MEILIRNQNKAVLLSFILGLFVGILYDFFKLVRKVVLYQDGLNSRFLKRKGEGNKKTEKTPNKARKIAEIIAVSLFDLTFCLLLCPIFCIFTYITVNGQFRWFIFAGAFFGALIYKITLGRPIGVVIDYISYLVFRFRHFIIDKIEKPLKKISKKIKLKQEIKRKRKEELARKKQRRVIFSYGKCE